MRPKVYVTQSTPHDLSPASKFGDIEVLLKSTVDQSHDTRAMIETFFEGLKNFSDDDFLVLVGDPVAMVLATCVALEVNGGRATVLKWSRNYGDYAPVDIDFNY